MPKRGTNAPGMAPLQRLVLEQMRKRGWDPKHVEERGMPHATLHAYMAGKPLSGLPRLATRQKLADALDLDVDEVTQAAKDSVGWTSNGNVARGNPRSEAEVDRHPVGYDLNAELDGLSDEEVESVLAVVRAMKRAKGR